MGRIRYEASPEFRLDQSKSSDQYEQRVAAMHMPATTASVKQRDELQRGSLETELSNYAYADGNDVGRRFYRSSPQWSVQEVQHMDDIRSAVNPAQAPVSVSAQVEGTATVGVNVTVDASPDRLVRSIGEHKARSCS
jgi:hypothetical protein